MGSVAEKRPALPTLAESNTEDDDDEDNEIVCYRSEQLDDKALLNGNGVVHGNCQGLQWLDQTAVKTVRAPDRTARFGTP